MTAAALKLCREPEPGAVDDGKPSGYGAKPRAGDPRYVWACHHSRWKLATWSCTDPTQVKIRTARCNSWRHGGECQRKKCAEDYSRIAEALKRYDREQVVYLVLTLDPSAWTPEGWQGPAKERRDDAVKSEQAIQQAYKDLVARWRQFSKSIRRRFGEMEYVSTVESHKSGWPHLNVVIVSPGLARKTEEESAKLRGTWSRKARGRKVAGEVFGKRLEAAGFGRIAFLEGARDSEALAGYIAKLAGTIGTPLEGAPSENSLIESMEGRMVGEIIKASQVPHDAPKGFRRLRSSKGFLPPKRRDEDITGALYDESGRQLGTKRVDEWIEQCQRNKNAPKPVRDAIERAMIQEMDKKEDHRLVENEDGSAGFELDRSAGMSTNDRVRLLYALAELRGEDPELALWEELSTEPPKKPPKPPCAHPIEPIGGHVLRGPEDIEPAIGPFGPGMQGSGRKLRLRPDLVYTPPAKGVDSGSCSNS